MNCMPSPTGKAKCFQLTEDLPQQGGVVWSATPIRIARSFTVNFDLYFGTRDGIVGQSKNPGADGIAFVLQNQGPETLGLKGGGLGFSGIAPSIGVEFDTYQNGGLSGDPPGDHIALVRDGKLNTGRLTDPLELGYNLEDGKFHPVKFEWIDSIQTIRVTVDGTLVLTKSSVDMASWLGSSGFAYLGFTSSTGNATNRHEVCIKSIKGTIYRFPSASPSQSTVPSNAPSIAPSLSSSPSAMPSDSPSASIAPSGAPSQIPSSSHVPSMNPSNSPSTSDRPSIAPVATQVPVATEAPVATQVPVATEAPVATQVPVATEAPVATLVPVATEVPVATQAPVATQVPVATQAPVATQVPVATEVPVTTLVPVAPFSSSVAPSLGVAAPSSSPSSVSAGQRILHRLCEIDTFVVYMILTYLLRAFFLSLLTPSASGIAQSPPSAMVVIS